jgi:Arabinose efflux permease
VPTPPTGTAAYSYDDAPLRPFHVRVAIASLGGVFSDGYGLGIVGISLAQATDALELTPLWLGLLGGAALAGLFLGALLTGPAADQLGRRPIYAYNMLALAVCAGLQFFVQSSGQLLVLRFVIGFLLGTDYVVSKALLVEFTPLRLRGRVLGTLSIAWAGGYACAYLVGFGLSDLGPAAWRWMLASSLVPCLLILPLRWRLPESPLWLGSHGRANLAAEVVARWIGIDVRPPRAASAALSRRGRWSQLFSPQWRRNTIVGAVFFTCQVIPYFAVGTFVKQVLDSLHVANSAVGGIAYNVALLAGSVLGVLVVDHLPRRTFLVGSFGVTALALVPLLLLEAPGAAVIVPSFVVFAGVLSAAASLCYVYLPELFPTDLRASGIGLAIASSRIGSAVSTFLLPLVVSLYSVQAALGACAAVLGLGAALCYAWAPETRNQPLDSMTPETT